MLTNFLRHHTQLRRLLAASSRRRGGRRRGQAERQLGITRPDAP